MSNLHSNVLDIIVSTGKGETRWLEAKIIPVQDTKSSATIKGTVCSCIHNKTKETKVRHSVKFAKVKLSTKRRALVCYTWTWDIIYKLSSVVLIRGWKTKRYSRCPVIMQLDGKYSFTSLDKI